jgi:hypothetical protein
VSTLSPAKALSQSAEGKIRSEDHRAALVPAGGHLEEQIGLFVNRREAVLRLAVATVLRQVDNYLWLVGGILVNAATASFGSAGTGCR